MEMFLYLVIIMPMMSVPPGLPMEGKINPNPVPQSAPPMMMDRKGAPWIIGPSSTFSKSERESERENTPKIVFARNFQPNIFYAAARRKILITK